MIVAPTIRDVIEQAVRERPGQRLVFQSPVHPSQTTFAAIYARARRLAGALWELGMRPGDVLMVRMPNWEEAVVVYQAGAILGCVLVPLIHIYQAAETGFVLRQSKAKAIVVAEQDAEMVASVRPETLEHLITAPGAVRELEARGLEPPVIDLDPDAVHVLAYTSGTTAEPKGVRHTNRTLLAECSSLQHTFKHTGDDTFFTPFPVGHIAGMMTVLVNPFLFGHDVIVMDGWDAGEALQLIETERVVRSGGAPFFLMTLLDHPDIARRDLSSLKTYGLGGAGVPPSLVERAEEIGVVAFRAYGSTEHPSATGGTIEDPLEKRAYTDGRPMPGCEVRIVDGEIQTRGPELFVGYSEPALDEDAITADGWFRTGDVGELDADGYLTVTDRIKEIIIRGGENVSAREVEEILVRMPQVADAAVTPVTDDRYGERVCAFVVSSGDGPPSLEQVRDHFSSAGVARQKWPERLELVDALPRTLAGKVQKYVLRARVEGR